MISEQVNRSEESPRTIGPYMIHGVLDRGGMATIHYGRLHSAGGFARTVVIKRLLPARAADPESVAMLVDEARVTARLRHVNLVNTLDVIQDGSDILLVLDYVHGESLM